MSLTSQQKEEVMSQVFDATSPEWAPKEVEAAVLVLEKVRLTQVLGKSLPGPVFEGHLAGKKNVSTEGVFFNGDSVYLIKRSSRLENASEPYPDMWHSPGVTHYPLESNQQGFARLIKRELGDVEILDQCGPFLGEGHDLPRARYVLLTTPTLIRGAPNADARGKLFRISEIPWDDLIASHRTTILPLAIDEARKEGWI